jgi:hypothetical protein
MGKEDAGIERVAQEDEELQTISARDFIPIKSIFGPIGQITEDEYMLIIETGPKNFFLFNEEGFDRMDAGFSDLCLALDEEEEIIGYVVNEFLDEKVYYEECRTYNKKNKEYRVRKLMNSILDFFEQKAVGQLSRRNFIILSYDVNKNTEQIAEIKTEESVRDIAAEKLLDRAAAYMDILQSKINIPSKILVGVELLDVLHKHLNKNIASDISLQDIINQESFSLYTTQMEERTAHLTKMEEVELVSLDYQKNNPNIIQLQEDFEKRLHQSIEEEQKHYQKKIDTVNSIFILHDNESTPEEQEFMEEEEFLKEFISADTEEAVDTLQQKGVSQ